MDNLVQKESARIVALMPCHNEEGRIGAVLRSIKETLPGADLVVIDDLSTDNSASEALAAGATVLRHACNMGYGAALETGYIFAVRGGYDIALQMDSDGQHLAGQLPNILGPALDGTADLVIGSRYLGSSGGAGTPAIRRLGHRFFGALVFLLTRMKLTDPTSGFQALNRRALELFSGGTFPCDYPDSDVILMSHMAGLRIREVPAEMKPRCGGKSMHSGLKPLYYGMKMLLSMFVVLLNVFVWRKWRALHGTQKLMSE